MENEVVVNPSVKITAEKPVSVVIRPRYVRVSISGYRRFFMSFDGDHSIVEKAFLDAFGVELEAKSKREPIEAAPKNRRGRKPKSELG